MKYDKLKDALIEVCNTLASTIKEIGENIAKGEYDEMIETEIKELMGELKNVD